MSGSFTDISFNRADTTVLSSCRVTPASIPGSGIRLFYASYNKHYPTAENTVLVMHEKAIILSPSKGQSVKKNL